MMCRSTSELSPVVFPKLPDNHDRVHSRDLLKVPKGAGAQSSVCGYLCQQDSGEGATVHPVCNSLTDSLLESLLRLLSTLLTNFLPLPSTSCVGMFLEDPTFSESLGGRGLTLRGCCGDPQTQPPCRVLCRGDRGKRLLPPTCPVSHKKLFVVLCCVFYAVCAYERSNVVCVKERVRCACAYILDARHLFLLANQ
jgi:hypothetical protein